MIGDDLCLSLFVAECSDFQRFVELVGLLLGLSHWFVKEKLFPNRPIVFQHLCNLLILVKLLVFVRIQFCLGAGPEDSQLLHELDVLGARLDVVIHREQFALFLMRCIILNA